MTSPLMQFLEEQLADRSRTMLRLSIPSTADLQAFHADMTAELARRQSAGELASVSPSFQWWLCQGTWPTDGDGWILLLQRAQFSANVSAAAHPGGYGNGQRGARR
jgi:hypothetical protein